MPTPRPRLPPHLVAWPGLPPRPPEPPSAAPGPAHCPASSPAAPHTFVTSSPSPKTSASNASAPSPLVGQLPLDPFPLPLTILLLSPGRPAHLERRLVRAPRRHRP